MVKHYNAKDVHVIVGARVLSGFDENSKVTVARSNDSYAKITGVDGETTRSKINDNSGEITLQLMRSSDDNDFLSELAIRDELSGDGVVTVTIKDQNGTTLHFTPSAWIRKPPDDAVEKEANAREWIFDCADLNMFSGGSVSK